MKNLEKPVMFPARRFHCQEDAKFIHGILGNITYL